MDAKKVKLINEWNTTDESRDAEITELIPHYLKVAEEYCNRSFDKSIPSGVEEFIAHSISNSFARQGSLKSRTMGTVSYTYNSDSEQDSLKLLNKYRKLNWGGTHVFD